MNPNTRPAADASEHDQCAVGVGENSNKENQPHTQRQQLNVALLPPKQLHQQEHHVSTISVQTTLNNPALPLNNHNDFCVNQNLLLFGSEDVLSEPEVWSDGFWSDSDLSAVDSEFSFSDDDDDDDDDQDDDLYSRRRRKRLKTDFASRAVLDLRMDLSNLPSFQRLPFRKQYLNAGLYAADETVAKRGNDRSTRIANRSNNNNDNNNTLRILSADRPPILPLPIHFGEWLMGEEKDFMLPYEIIFQNQNKLFEVDREPPSYVKIRSKRKRRIARGPVCECQPVTGDREGGCGEDCINRCTFYECNVKTCPNGERCTNRRFQLKQTLADKLKVFCSGDKRGFGLRTLVAIKRGELVIEYRGEVISQETCVNRMETDYASARCFYFLDYDNGEVLDGTVKGNDARYVNHSCDPNCHIEKWHVDGEFAVGLFASRDIREDEELTYDYNFHTYGEQAQFCLCGSSKCRGLMGKSSEYRDGANAVPLNAGKKRGPAPIVGRRRRQLQLQHNLKHYQLNRPYYTGAKLLLLRNIYTVAAAYGAKNASASSLSRSRTNILRKNDSTVAAVVKRLQS